MKKKESYWAVGPSLKVYGKKAIRQIREAMDKLGLSDYHWEIGWVFNIPVPEDGSKEFYMLTRNEEAIKALPVDFAEQMQTILNEAKVPEFPPDRT